MHSGPNLFCRFCGIQYSSLDVDEHDNICLGRITQKSLNSEESPEEKQVYPLVKSYTDERQRELDKSFNRKTLSPKYDDKASVVTKEHSVDQGKEEMAKTPYPSSENIVSENIKKDNEANPPVVRTRSESPGETSKQAWNALSGHKLSSKPPPPEPTKPYRYYPVSCEFCNQKFQPGVLRKHIQEKHPDAHLPPRLRGSKKGKIRPPEEDEPKEKEAPRSPGPRFKICYICGRQYGSKSLPIHEPQCLEKWRAQNDQLPPDRRMPEPVKPQVSTGESGGGGFSGNKDYKEPVPEMSRADEAAYQAHLKGLAPCSFCGRRFTPDRVMVHENACIERPKKRTYIVPDKNSIK